MPLLAAAAATHGSRPHGERNLRLAAGLPTGAQRHRTAASRLLFSGGGGGFFSFLTWHLFSRGEAGQAESTFRVREGLRDPYCLHPSNFHPTRLLPYLTDTVLSLNPVRAVS